MEPDDIYSFAAANHEVMHYGNTCESTATDKCEMIWLAQLQPDSTNKFLVYMTNSKHVYMKPSNTDLDEGTGLGHAG